MDVPFGSHKSIAKSVATVNTCLEGQETKYRSGNGSALEFALTEMHGFVPRLCWTSKS